MAWLRWLLRRRAVLVAVKAALACGVAFYLGALLPAPIDDYKYYAALGAYTVVGLVVVDSVKESLQVLGAVAIGVGVALVAQTLSWANAGTVAATIAVGVLLSSARLFGAQRTWAPLAGLFVLATGGPDPEPMALGYLVQLPLGALVGLLVNALVFTPLGNDDLRPATDSAVRLLSTQMTDYADLLDTQARAERATEAAELRDELVHASWLEVEDAQRRLRAAITEARRGMRGNPRLRLSSSRHLADLDRAQAVSRCTATLMAVGIMLGESDAAQGGRGDGLRSHAADALRRTAEVLDDPDQVRDRPELLEDAEESIERMLLQARSRRSDEGHDHLLFGTLALTLREGLGIFTRHVAEIDAPDVEEPR